MPLLRWILPRTLCFLSVSAVVALGSGCDAPPETTEGPPEARSGSAAQALLGQDGALTVNAPSTVLNQYAVLGANAAAGATSITVTNINDLNSAQFGPLAPGDLILLVQMQGATIDTSNTAQYGAVTNLGDAGRYEIIGVAGTQGNTIQLDTSCSGLKFAYSTAGNVQVVRVPQLTSLTVTAAGSITAPAWDGQRGGVVAVHAQGAVTRRRGGALGERYGHMGHRP